MKKAGFFLVLLCVSHFIQAQNFPGKKVNDFLKLAWDIQFDNPDSAQVFLSKAFKEFYKLQKSQHPDTVNKYKAELYNQQGIVFYLKSDYPNAIKNYKISLEAKQQTGDSAGIAMSYNNIAVAFQYMGNVDEAVKHHFKAYKLRARINDTNGQAMSLNNIGLLYKDQKLYEKALNYFEDAMKLIEKAEDSYMKSAIWNNIGSILASEGNYDEAYTLFKKSAAFDSLQNDTGGYILALCNIGQLLESKNDLVPAEKYLNRAIILSEENKFTKGLAMAYKNFQALEVKRKNYQKGIEYGEKALRYFKEIQELFGQKTVLENLSEINSKTGNYQKAYEWQSEFIKVQDSISNIDKKEALLQSSMQFNFEQEQLEDSIIHARKEKEFLLQEKLRENQLKSEQYFRYLLIAVAFLLLVFAVLMYNRFKITRQQKSIIETQKLIVEEKNKEVMDSLKYAKRIQEAILPSIQSMNDSLKNGFVIYIPKEVVAGDFYWLEHYKNKIYFAVADCTGHGVPGAMMSVVCSNALSKALLEDGQENTGKLLDRTRDIVIGKMMKSGEEVNDGMDVSLIAIEGLGTAKVKMQWSGANNPLYIIRKNNENFQPELIEFSPDKQPIGKYARSTPFTSHDFELKEGDSIYLFSDGYADQFGGDASQKSGGKKYKASRLKQSLISIYDKKMPVQKDELITVFHQWKGDLEQIDDVCIIGVRI